jgi:hypothetical protein
MDPTVTDQQDALRSVRTFVNVLGGGLNAYAADQSMNGTDWYAGNAPYQYQNIGPYGVSVEGLPVQTTRQGGLVISPGLVLILLGAAFVLMHKA